MTIRWQNAAWVLALAAPIVAMLLFRRKPLPALVFSSVALFDRAGDSGVRTWLARLPLLLAFGSMALMVAALARPLTPEESTRIDRPRGTLLLAVDVSGSMGAVEVVGPTTRLDQVKRLLRGWLQENSALPERPAVGLLSFAATPRLASPPTTDYGAVAEKVEELSIDSTDNRTDIGAALASAIDLAAAANFRHRRILLLTDGAQRVPESVGPIGAARIATALHVPIDVVGVGTAQGNAAGFEADEAVAKRIAEISGGAFRRIESVDEKSPLWQWERGRNEAEGPFAYRRWKDLYGWLVVAALAMWTAAELLSRTWLRIIPD